MIEDILYDTELILELVEEQNPGQAFSYSLDGVNYDSSSGERSAVHIE